MAEIELLENILKHVAESLNITSYEVIPDKNVEKGDGFLSEFLMGDVKNKSTGELFQTYIKLSPQKNRELIFTELSNAYVNEYNFYAKINESINSFQKEKGIKSPFDKIPKFFCGNIEPNKEYIVLENLKAQNYVLYDKSKSFTQHHLETLFTTYGKYHALTFAFKDQCGEKYQELLQPLTDVIPGIFAERVIMTVKSTLKIAQATIKESSEENALRIQPYIDNFEEIITKTLIYKGDHSALTHGDCWSNNMLFKYNDDGNIENLRLIDFQLTRDSTPVHDLSYFFYSGASKADFDKLDTYLDLYYKSFSDFSKELGSDPEKLLPLEVLRSDWKKYSFFGITMSLMLWPIKLMKKDQIKDYTENPDDHGNIAEIMAKIMTSDYLKTNVSNILLHALEYNIL